MLAALTQLCVFQDLPPAAMATMGAFLCAAADSRYILAPTQDNVPPSPPFSCFLAQLSECCFRDVDMSSGNFSPFRYENEHFGHGIQIISVLIFNLLP